MTTFKIKQIDKELMAADAAKQIKQIERKLVLWNNLVSESWR